MFANLLSFWKGKDFLAHVLGEFKDMLDETEHMFKSVCNTLLDNVEDPDLEKKVYKIDKKVNKLQKDIRKRIVAHLSLQPSVDVPACLLLMSVVKDAERLGDYAKNLYEVIKLLEKPLDRTLFCRFFDNLDTEILQLFEQTKEAFIESDDTKASQSWSYVARVTKRCDAIIAELAKSTALTVNQGVCLTLIARHFKRIAAHLVNIATSVILPLDELDYYDERMIRE
jgi:phosphate transport system protein